jgi:hypothetical protein
MNYFGDFIIPCCNIFEYDFIYRLRNIKLICELLPKNINIIIIEQIMSKDSTSYVDALKTSDVFRDDIKYIKKYYDKDFVKGWLYNVGYKKSLTDNLFLGESDVIFSPVYWNSIIKQLQNHNINWAHCWDKLYQISSDNMSIIKEVKPYAGGTEGGVVYFKKHFYEKIGGSNEWMKGLGGMDNEIVTRCAYKSKSRIKLKGEIYHLWHPFSEMKGTNKEKNIKTENKYKHNRKRNTKIVEYIGEKTKTVIDNMFKYKENIGGDMPLCEIVDLFNDINELENATPRNYLNRNKTDKKNDDIKEITYTDEGIEYKELNKPYTINNRPNERRITKTNNTPHRNGDGTPMDTVATNRKRIQKRIIKNPAVVFKRNI